MGYPQRETRPIEPIPSGPPTRSHRLASRALRLARRWLDPSSRRPLVLLVVLVLGVLLAPLALDVAHALFFRLTFRVRWWLGQAAFVVILGLGVRRVLTIRPGDRWPDLEPARAPRTRSDRAVPWLLRLAILPLVAAIWPAPDALGFADWDFVLDKFEAARQTILDWHQFPWWDPWCRGGFALAAEPQIGAISIATPLYLGLGTTTGLAVAAVLGIGIAVEGAYRLGLRWLDGDPWAAAVVALVYGLNGAVSVNTAWGYVLPMSYGSLPWMIHCACGLGRRRRDAAGLGAWAAFASLNGIQYLNLYAASIVAVVWLRAWRLADAAHGRRRLVAHTLVALGVALALCGWRLATVADVLRGDRREPFASFWSESLASLPHYLLSRPRPDWPTSIPAQHAATFIELTCYVGPVALALGLASLRWGWRWWHTLATACTLLAMGSVEWYDPSYWLASWPGFASLHVVTRWRFVATLGLGLAAGSVVLRLRHSGLRPVRRLAPALVLLLGADFLHLARQQLPIAFSAMPRADADPGPPVATIANVRQALGFAATRRRYGVVEGYEPMVGGYRRDAPTLRQARTDPGYRGEAWTAARNNLEPAEWSPNRIVFRVAPGETVFVNQNPGSWWLANGTRAFPSLTRCAEAMEPFAARADAAGRLELTIHPPWFEAGLALHAVGAVLALAAWQWDRRQSAQSGTASSAPMGTPSQ